MQTIDSKLLSRIYGGGRGSVFTPNDFLDLGGRNAVDKGLSRLVMRGTIRRLARGLSLLYSSSSWHSLRLWLFPVTQDDAS